MRIYLLAVGAMAAILLLSYCNPGKKLAGASATSYEKDVHVLVMQHCTPCHIPAKGGNKKAYDNYASVKTDIDEIIRRIELSPSEKGFMPFRKLTKLSDSTINVLKQWRDNGMWEK
jgi:uncharacterized membrane protein